MTVSDLRGDYADVPVVLFAEPADAEPDHGQDGHLEELELEDGGDR